MKLLGHLTCLTLVVVLSVGCSSATLELQGANRHLLQQASNCTSNGRITENNMPCCFPAVYNGVTYNDCWAIDDDPYCYVSTRSSRSTLARCQRKGATQPGTTTTNNNTNSTVPQAFRDSFGNFTNATAPTALPSNFSSQFGAGITRAPTPLPARTNSTANTSSINAQFSNIFEPAPAPSRNASFAPPPTPAVRYTINDQRCVFPATLSNGTVVYNCFGLPSVTQASEFEYEYCLVTASSTAQPVQCAAPGYKPSVATPAPVGLCAGSAARKTDTGANCTFPQFNSFGYWVCGCYSLSSGAEASSASNQSYCIPSGQTAPALCTPITTAASNATNTTVAASSGSDDSSSNTGLIVGLAVGIPLGLLAIAAVAGGAWYYTKRRPMARATSFRKWDEGDTSVIAKGSISSKDVAKSGASLSSVSKYAEPI